MKIGELAKRAEVPIDTVRYYEREGLIPHPFAGRPATAITWKQTWIAYVLCAGQRRWGSPCTRSVTC